MRATSPFLAPLGILVVIALSLSGCVHVDRSVALNSDGSGTYVLTMGINDQLLSLSGDQVTTQMNNLGARVKQEGGSFREYDLEAYTYWSYKRPFSSVKQLNSLLTDLPQSSSATGGSPSTSSTDTISFSEQSGFLSKTFHVTGHISLATLSGSTDSGAGGTDVSQYLKDMRDSFAVTMPGSISAHKGGVVNGNTVTYTVHYGEQTDIDVTGGGLDMSVVAPIAAGSAGALILAAAIIGYLIWRSRARSARPALQADSSAASVEQTTATWAPPQPHAPATQSWQSESPQPPTQPE
ncbi:MAG TPA: hypothetical protein VF808_12415 [Ktedonobacterales bacterium]